MEVTVLIVSFALTLLVLIVSLCLGYVITEWFERKDG